MESMHPSLGFPPILSNGEFAEIYCVGTPSLDFNLRICLLHITLWPLGENTIRF